MQAVAAALPAAFRPFAPGLAKGLGPSLNHRLWRVRVAALGALDACVSTVDPLKRKGAGTEAIQPLVGHRDDNVIPIRAFYKGEVTRNRFAPLSLDPVPAVRRRFFAAVSSWLWSLPDRMDHESRLLPYLLTALADEDDDIAAGESRAWPRRRASGSERALARWPALPHAGPSGGSRGTHASRCCTQRHPPVPLLPTASLLLLLLLLASTRARVYMHASSAVRSARASTRPPPPHPRVPPFCS